MLANFPLFCTKCKEESLIDAEKFIVKEARR
ncbi:cysteine-rich KTR domain-containing protein [Blautia acetigignens]